VIGDVGEVGEKSMHPYVSILDCSSSFENYELTEKDCSKGDGGDGQ
jgi:hypothetical protein